MYRARRRVRKDKSLISRTVIRRTWKRVRLPLLAAVVLVLGFLIFARYFVHQSAEGTIFYRLADVRHERVALVLGAGIRPDGTLSTTLRYRVDRGIELYKAGKVDKLLMSGDNRIVGYNEPRRMTEYAVLHGVPARDVRMDFAGRRTYDSIYRAKHIFGLDRVLVVSQEYHLDRSLFLCRKLGLQAYGVAAPTPNNLLPMVREYPADVGALLDVYLLHPEPLAGKPEPI